MKLVLTFLLLGVALLFAATTAPPGWGAVTQSSHTVDNAKLIHTSPIGEQAQAAALGFTYPRPMKLTGALLGISLFCFAHAVSGVLKLARIQPRREVAASVGIGAALST